MAEKKKHRNKTKTVFDGNIRWKYVSTGTENSETTVERRKSSDVIILIKRKE